MIILSPQLGISPTATTGGETYDREVLRQFVRLVQDVKILLPRGKPIPADISEKIIDRTPIGHFVPPYTFNIFSISWIFKKVGAWVPKVRPLQKTILRIHSPEYLFFTGYLVKKLYPNILLVAHYHLDQTGWLWTEMNRVLLNMADAVIADSEYLKDRLVNRVGVKPEKIEVIHCGVDVDAIKPLKHTGSKGSTLAYAKVEPYKTKQKTILFLGRFIPRKRPDFAVEVFAKLHHKHPNTRLVMVGEGPEEANLKSQVSNLKLENAVEMPGPLFGDKKLKRYHEADLFLFPSEHEGFVLVVLEAMAAGLPLLVPRALGFGEAVEDGGNGLLATPGDIDDWVGRAEKILFNEKMNQAMRKRSRELAVKKFSWEQCAKKNIEAYRRILEESVYTTPL